MPGKFSGRTAFITGVARGQGRAHAVRLASEGADIIGIDICADIPSIDYPNATEEDLEHTAKLVSEQGQRMVARKADVRDLASLRTAFQYGIAEFGRIDIVIANAGVVRLGTESETLDEWNDIIETNLTGVFNTVRTALPDLIEGSRGGAIVITSSSAGLKGTGSNKAGQQAYTAAKRGQVGYMQTLANDLAKHWIRVNTIHPTGVATGMVFNEAMQRVFEEGSGDLSAMQNALPIEILQPEDIANAVAWLVSDEQKFITGISLPLDAGFSVR